MSNTPTLITVNVNIRDSFPRPTGRSSPEPSYTDDQTPPAARIMEWNALRLMSAIKGRGLDPALQASISKVFASTAHLRIGELGMRVAGAASELVGPGYHLDRLQQVFLGSRAESIYGGTTQIQYNVIGERTLGLPRDPR